MIDTGLLGGSAILARLNAGEIFVPGTWETSQVRGAGYDIRMATDLLFITNSDGVPLKYEVGNHRTEPVILEPSGVAMVSTTERFRLPQDLGAHVSVKWSLSRVGVLVLTGGFINPGFGYKKIAGKLEPSPDERLHFLIVNLGSEPHVLIPRSTSLASLQFVTIIGSAENKVADSLQSEIIAEDANAPAKALSLFPQFSSQKELLDRLDERLSRVENGTQPLVTFGIYLVAITFLGVILNATLGLASDSSVTRLARALPHNPSFTVIVVTLLIFLTVVSKRILDVLVEATKAVWRWKMLYGRKRS